MIRNTLLLLPLATAFFSNTCIAEPATKLENAFTKIYQNKTWGTNEEGEGFSGTGSCLDTTEEYRKFLQFFMEENNIKTVVDAGCGDWTFSKAIDWSKVNYKGYDVVKHVIEQNKEKYASPTVEFEHCNLVEKELPVADLLICKDVLQHLSNRDIAKFLKQLPKFRFCLITNDVNPRTHTSINYDIKNGEYRHLDLTQPPFSIAGAKILSYESCENLKQVLLIQTK